MGAAFDDALCGLDDAVFDVFAQWAVYRPGTSDTETIRVIHDPDVATYAGWGVDLSDVDGIIGIRIDALPNPLFDSVIDLENGDRLKLGRRLHEDGELRLFVARRIEE